MGKAWVPSTFLSSTYRDGCQKIVNCALAARKFGFTCIVVAKFPASNTHFSLADAFDEAELHLFCRDAAALAILCAEH